MVILKSYRVILEEVTNTEPSPVSRRINFLQHIVVEVIIIYHLQAPEDAPLLHCSVFLPSTMLFYHRCPLSSYLLLRQAHDQRSRKDMALIPRAISSNKTRRFKRAKPNAELPISKRSTTIRKHFPFPWLRIRK